MVSIMELSFDSFRNEFDVTLKGAVSHRVALGTDARGNITRLDNDDGKTGKQEDVLSVSEGVIEASPAVYDNYAVVGTRDCKIWGIRLR